MSYCLRCKLFGSQLTLYNSFLLYKVLEIVTLLMENADKCFLFCFYSIVVEIFQKNSNSYSKIILSITKLFLFHIY